MDGRKGSRLSVYSQQSATHLALITIVALLPVHALAQESLSKNWSIEEIIVTARKIEENAQEVPMSLQVLSSDYLADSALNHFYDLQFSIPAYVVKNQGVFGAGNSLRGISSATHLDGVYQGTSNLAITRLFDLERIEVLKGPQGTLYGRNATGGSVNIVTHSPDDEFSAGLEATRGSFDLSRLTGYLNLPLDSGAIRLAAIGSDSDGYIRNSIDDRRFAENDYYGIRASYNTRAYDRFGVELKVQHVVDDGGSGDLWVPRKDYLPDPEDIRLTTVTLGDPFLESENNHASATLELQLDFATLRSISGYANSEVSNRDDCAGIPILAGCVREIIPLKSSQRSQEFQLVSQQGQALDWLAGAYYFDSNASYNYVVIAPLISPLPQNDYFNSSEETVLALFGQASLHLTEAWELTGGLRLSRTTVRRLLDGQGWADNPGPLSAKKDWQDCSWRLDTTYHIRDELLLYAGLSTGFNTGDITTEQKWPSGQTGGLVSVDPEYLTAFEVGVKSFWKEGQIKLNAAPFYYYFKDMQLETRTFVGNTFVFVTDNVAKAELYGLDTALEVKLTDRLDFSSGLVWMPRRQFVDYNNSITGDTLSGKKVPLASQWSTTTSLDYQRPITGIGTVRASLEYSFRSHYYFTENNTPYLDQGSFGLLNARLKFESLQGKWYLFASARNIGDKDYFTTVFLQSAPGYPNTYEVGIGLQL